MLVTTKVSNENTHSLASGITGHTQKNGAVLIWKNLKPAPFFYVYPVHSSSSFSSFCGATVQGLTPP
jgi:hypothetical protein